MISRAVSYFIFSDKIVAGWVANSFTNCCFDCFAIGSLLAYYSLYRTEKLRKILKFDFLFIFFGLGGSLTCYLLSLAGSNPLAAMILMRFLFACFCFWLIGNANEGYFTGIFRKILQNKVLIYLGKISYGLYVYHFFMTYIFSYFNFPFKTYLYPVVTIGLAAASWQFYESPINNLKKYISYKKRKPENLSGKLIIDNNVDIESIR